MKKKERKLATQAPDPNPAALAAARRVPKKVAKRNPTLGNELRQMVEPLTMQDAALYGYMVTLSDPWIQQPSGVPLILGSGVLSTDKFKVERTFTVTAGTNGFGFLSVVADGWSNVDTVDTRTVSYNGGTHGNDVFYTTSAYTATTFPAQGSSGTVGVNPATVNLVDAKWNGNTRVRCVAVGIRAWNDAPSQTAQGDLYVLSTMEPVNDKLAGGIPGSDESTFTQLNRQIMSREAASLSGWISGHHMSTFAVPTGRKCWEFFDLPAAGVTTFNYPNIAVCMTGCVVGQTIKVQVVKIFESEFVQDNRVDVDPNPTLHVSPDEISNGIRALPHVSAPPRAPHGPTEILNGAGAKGMLQHALVTRPLKLPSMQQHASSSTSFLGSALKTGLSFVKSMLPGWVRKAATVVSGILDS